MYSDHGCRGAVDLGDLSDGVAARLLAVPGEWLEYDPATRCVVVRHAQPTSGPDLPVITSELVQLLSQIPPKMHAGIVGGAFYVHTLDTGQFVRLRVDAGGVLELQWAHPDFSVAEKRPYRGRVETALEPAIQRLDGRVRFVAADPHAAAAKVNRLADTFEGLYPQGSCEVQIAASGGRVEIELEALNLDSHLLVRALEGVAESRSLDGRIVVSAFGREVRPEEMLRIAFQDGQTLVQHPVLWPDETGPTD